MTLPLYSQGQQAPNSELIHPSDRLRVNQLLSEHLSGKQASFEVSYRLKGQDGYRWVLDQGKVVEWQDEQPLRMTGTLKNISSLKAAEHRLSLYARCFEHISDAVAIFDRHFRIVDVNPSYLQLSGEQRQQIIGKPFMLAAYSAKFNQQLKDKVKQERHWFSEIKAVKANGHVFPAELTIDVITNEHRHITHFVAIFSDISQRKAAEIELHKLSSIDRLTNLPNRNQFFTSLQHLVAKQEQHALLMFDLDDFKKINDSLGHQLGDNLLCVLAERLKAVVRSQDSIYRLGGDEFAVVLEGTNDILTITSMAKKVLAEVCRPLTIANHELVVTSSVGIVLFPEDGNDPETLLRNADTAMYHAKQDGNRYLFFNEHMNRQAVKRLQLENLIRIGLKEDCFLVHYQPKMDMRTGQIAGMEALVRFQTSSKSLISPAAFIPVAEETGQIVEIGEVVLRKACRQMRQWHDQGLFPGRVAVNLSAKQFNLPNLCERIDNILRETGLSAAHLELEITEGTVMNSPTDAIATMQQLRERGIHLAMDDFGTGYSSLAYLKQFPLNTLKIDKAFIDDMVTSKGRNMVDSIVTIAHNLNLQVVAEGVESAQQANWLSQLNCKTIQGYYFSKPLAAEQFVEFMTRQLLENELPQPTQATIIATL